MRVINSRMLLVLVFGLLLQSTLLDRIRLVGIQPDLFLVIAICGGIVAGAERGAFVGFFAGLFADLFLTTTPFGLSALIYSVVGFVVGATQASVIRMTWWIVPVSAFISSAMGVILYGVVGAMVGQSHFVSPRLVVMASVVAVVSAPLSLPVVRAIAWAVIDPDEDRAYAH